MNSRIDKYNDTQNQTETPSRVARNQSLYNDLGMPDFSSMKPNDNVKVIENTGNRIDLSKIKEYIESSEEERTQSRSVVVKEDIDVIPESNLFEEEKDYDINSILEKAKEKKESYYEDEKHKKLRDTQYDILSKIKVYDEPEEEEPKKLELNTDEKTLVDLINTVTKNKGDLLEELKKGSEDTVVTFPINDDNNEEIMSQAIEEAKSETMISSNSSVEEILKGIESSKQAGTLDLKEVTSEETSMRNLDKSFYTNSMSFSKEDFEGFEELEKTVKKNNNAVKLGIIGLILLALATIFVVLKYVLNLF